MSRLVLAIMLIAALACVLTGAVVAEDTIVDPWMNKPVLSVLMLTNGEDYVGAASAIAEALSLTPEESESLESAAISERDAVAALYQESIALLQGNAVDLQTKRRVIEQSGYNSRLASVIEETDHRVRESLGNKYGAFRKEIRQWWAIQRARVAARDSTVAPTIVDPWMSKPVLSVLMLTAGEDYKGAVSAIVETLSLTPEEIKGLECVAVYERDALAALHQDSDTLLQRDTRDQQTKRRMMNHSTYNSRLASVIEETDHRVRKLLGNKYEPFRREIRQWWAAKRARVIARDSAVAPTADIFSRVVFATQYVGHTDYEVALPDKKVKLANKGSTGGYPNPPYTADLYRSATDQWVDEVLVLEVGPWNEDDNYWDEDRRIFQDLPLGKPEAEAAYWDDYNAGKDQFGRTVANPAGVDLTPDLAADLGLSYLQNAEIRVYYL